MNYSNDDRIVMLLDAGGTNFVFSAIQKGEEIVKPIITPSNGDNLDLCLKTIIEGFNKVKSELPLAPSAISFAFPGPADYPNGIIGDLKNLPAFRGGVPLGPILENEFKIPVFINNDGDLFAYGEALSGILPEINEELENNGQNRRYKNLIGITIGTGFGAGVVRNNELFLGDNSMGAEVWILSNRYDSESFAENTISTEAIKRSYIEYTGKENNLMPKDIYDIAMGNKEGDQEQAKLAFEEFGKNIGEILGNLISLFDSVIVIGGGIAGANELYMPAIFKELNKNFRVGEDEAPRTVQKVFNYDIPHERQEFLSDNSKDIVIPTTGKTIKYDSNPRLVIATSKVGASKAISIGAYTYALQHLKK